MTETRFRIDPERLRARLAAAIAVPGLRRGGLRVRGDHDLAPDLPRAASLRQAAVLAPIVLRPDGLTVLLTQRSPHLADHAGQISFPGGRLEAGDADAAAAALREAQEEIGLDPAQVELIGRLDTYQTRTGYEITPLVGLVSLPVALRLDPTEVAEAFEVPLEFLVDPRNRRREARRDGARERAFWAIPWRSRYIWGATAGMLVNLAELLAEA